MQPRCLAVAVVFARRAATRSRSIETPCDWHDVATAVNDRSIVRVCCRSVSLKNFADLGDRWSDAGQVKPNAPTKLRIIADWRGCDPVAIPAFLQQAIDVLDRRVIQVLASSARTVTGTATQKATREVKDGTCRRKPNLMLTERNLCYSSQRTSNHAFLCQILASISAMTTHSIAIESISTIVPGCRPARSESIRSYLSERRF